MLILVRHAMPVARQDLPPHEWVLSDEGEAAAALLRAALPSVAALVSSDEQKAWMTLGVAGAGVVRDARFNEVTRHGEPWDGNFRKLRRHYVEGTSHPHWEAQADVAARFDAGVTHHRAHAGTHPLVIATHGMAMTTWLVHVGAVSRHDAGDFWLDLRFPDAHVVDLKAGSVERLAMG